MATLRATFMTVEGRATTGATVPLGDLSGSTRLANLTTSGTSQVLQAVGGGDFVAPSAGVIFLAADAAVNVNAGATPVAAATTGMYLLAGVQYTFSLDSGDKLAAIDG